MANAVTANKIYVDSTGAVSTSRLKVAYIIFTPDASGDQIAISETISGAVGFYARGATAKDTITFDFSLTPLVFTNGVYIQTITSGAKAILITTNKGAE